MWTDHLKIGKVDGETIIARSQQVTRTMKQEANELQLVGSSPTKQEIYQLVDFIFTYQYQKFNIIIWGQVDEFLHVPIFYDFGYISFLKFSRIKYIQNKVWSFAPITKILHQFDTNNTIQYSILQDKIVNKTKMESIENTIISILSTFFLLCFTQR